MEYIIINIQAVREVRDEAGHLLEQIKLLSSKNDDLRAEKAKSDDRINQLTEEVEYEIETFIFSRNSLIVTNLLFLLRFKNGKVNMKKVDWNYVH